MKSHEIDYEIKGHGIQAVEVELDPEEVVIAEAGAMNYLEEDINFEVKMGDGADQEEGFFGKVFKAGKRMLTGESLFLTHFTNIGNKKRKISFAAPYPGEIIPIDLENTENNEFICQKGAFLCGAKGTSIDIAFTKKLSTGLFGGEGFVLQKLSGDGKIFIHAGGTIIKKELNNESIFVDTGCLVGFHGDIDLDIIESGGLKSMLFGGEGLFLTKLSGAGIVYIQTMPFNKLAETIIQQSNIEQYINTGGSTNEDY